MAFQPIQFFVPGVPKTAGSKKAFPLWKGKGASRQFVRSIITDSSGAAGREWRSAIQAEASGVFAGGELIDSPIRLTVTFVVVRPKGHSGTKGLKPSAPRFPTTKPDATKMTRAVEDALTGVVWRDDACVVTQAVRKRYGEFPGVHVRIEEETE